MSGNPPHAVAAFLIKCRHARLSGQPDVDVHSEAGPLMMTMTPLKPSLGAEAPGISYSYTVATLGISPPPIAKRLNTEIVREFGGR